MNPHRITFDEFLSKVIREGRPAHQAGLRVMQTFTLITMLWIFVSVVAFLGMRDDILTKKDSQYATGEMVAKSLAREKAQEWAKSLFDDRLKRYTEDLSTMNSTLSYLLLLILVTYLVLVGQVEELHLPFLGMNIKVTAAICMALGCCIFFFWLKFGFTANNVVEERISGWRLGEALEPELAPSSNPSIFTVVSHRQLLEDSGLMDAWFTCFFPKRTGFAGYDSGTTDLTGSVLVVLLAGLALGVANGCALGMMWQGYLLAPTRMNWIFLSTVWLLFLVTHTGFLYFKKNPNWMQAVALTICLIVVWCIRWWTRSPNSKLVDTVYG